MLYRFKKTALFSLYRRRGTRRRAESLRRGRRDDAELLALLFLPSPTLPNATLLLAPYSAHGAAIALPLIDVDSEVMLVVA